MLRRLPPLLAIAFALAFPGLAHAGPLAWSGAANISASALTAVSCPSISLCVAADAAQFSNMHVTTNPSGGAASWSANAGVGQNSFQSINAMSCPTTSLCVASDNAGWIYWSTNPAANAWSDTGVGVNGGASLRAISCASASLCVAAGSNGNIVWSTNPTGGAGAWTQANASDLNLVLSISCPTVALCVAGDDAGNIITSTNPTGGALEWISADAVSGDIIRGMSCPTTSLCVAGDDAGFAIHSTNPTGGLAAWSSEHVATGFRFLPAISCPTTTFCVGGDSGGGVIETIVPTGLDTDWTTTDIGTAMNDVSCATTELCVAVASGGNAYVGTQGTVTVSLAGSGTGSVSGSGIACPPTCTRSYPGGTNITLSAAPAADGSTFEGWSGACTGTGDCSLTMASNRAVTATFSAPPAPPPAVQSSPAPSQQAPTALPPPVVAKTANAFPVQPGVLVKPPGATRFVPLASPSQVQFGAVIDARKGRVRIVIANGKGGTDSADFYGGIFRIVQRAARVPVAELILQGGSFRACRKPGSRRARSAARPGKSIRRLWGDGGGSFRTRGRYAAATVRGTRWLTDDRCNGTLVRVAAGAVTVRDLVKRRNVVVRARRSYFAAA